MDHLGSGVSLLLSGSERHAIELTDRIVAFQNDARVLPSDRGASFDLSPGDLASATVADSAFGDEVVDPADAGLGVTRIPVLNRAVLDRRIVSVGNELDNCGVKLILISHRSGTAFEIADVAALFADNQSSLELPRVLGVDPEVGAQFHWAAGAFRNIHK